MVLHRDTPVFVPNSSVNIKQADLFAVEGNGHWTRPHDFAAALSIEVGDEGAFKITWKDGVVSYVNATSVASYAIS